MDGSVSLFSGSSSAMFKTPNIIKHKKTKKYKLTSHDLERPNKDKHKSSCEDRNVTEGHVKGKTNKHRKRSGKSQDGESSLETGSLDLFSETIEFASEGEDLSSVLSEVSFQGLKNSQIGNKSLELLPEKVGNNETIKSPKKDENTFKEPKKSVTDKQKLIVQSPRKGVKRKHVSGF